MTRPKLLDAIDDAFVRICIEELAEGSRSAENGEPLLSREETLSSSREDTVLDEVLPLESLAEEGGEADKAAAGPSAPQVEGAASVAVPAPPTRWQLRLVYPDGRECALPLEDQPISVGRGRHNSIVVKSKLVSREHARIWVDVRGPRIDDLGSHNGLKVNGIKVPAAYLQPHDVVKIGDLCIHLEPLT